MRMEVQIAGHIEEFKSICKEHKVEHLYAFGSSVSDRFDERTSDIDLLVELSTSDPLEKGELLLSLWDTLEGFFDRKVDLLTEQSIKNPILRKSIEQSKQLIYDRTGEKVFV
ncbi:nucleotidyltransferase family protein [Echinicola sp. 20G]|uniref:nucleotidyltransferase family protein n=1 Tax=Echinicola sp. 20G TaxID=2781961 RepID=UPI001F2B07DC|nr:nucleotidyltransferase domain-containing protein [Echinicola sp. 20G]